MSVRKHIPNAITSLNLLCGVIGIILTLGGGKLELAFLFMLAAVVFDFCDGLAARLLGAGPLPDEADEDVELLLSRSRRAELRADPGCTKSKGPSPQSRHRRSGRSRRSPSRARPSRRASRLPTGWRPRRIGADPRFRAGPHRSTETPLHQLSRHYL